MRDRRALRGGGRRHHQEARGGPSHSLLRPFWWRLWNPLLSGAWRASERLRRYLVEASSEGTRVKGGAQTFVLWVLRTAAALMLTQSWSDPWVGSALAVVVYSAHALPLPPTLVLNAMCSLGPAERNRCAMHAPTSRRRPARTFRPAGVITGWLYSVARSAQHAAQTTAHVAQIALSPLQGLRSPASAAKASARRPADGRGGPLASPDRKSVV